jgi:hypothetical protein
MDLSNFSSWLQVPGSAHVQLKPKAESGQSSGTSSAYGHGKLTEPDNRGTFDLYLASAMCSNE